MRTTHVSLGERSYEIRVGLGLAGEIRGEVEAARRKNRPVAVVMDAGFAAAQPEFLAEAAGDVPSLELPSGENTKSLRHLGEVLDFLAARKLDRSSRLFLFGGGVTGDLGGFAAASYLRGIDFIQIPTTLLAMVDSSVGGKTGANLAAGKNLVGAFHQPAAVYADMKLLETLPAREFAAGMAEVVKYGLLGDGELYARLLAFDALSPAHPDLPEIVARCCANKARIVEADERENSSDSGGRALLNLGHTFAHAIEAVAGYGEYLHGEAVAVGLLCALRLSENLGFMEEGAGPSLSALLERHGLPVALRQPLSIEALLDAMFSDKKTRGGTIRFVVMDAVGESRVTDEVELGQIEKVWRSAGAS